MRGKNRITYLAVYDTGSPIKGVAVCEWFYHLLIINTQNTGSAQSLSVTRICFSISPSSQAFRKWAFPLFDILPRLKPWDSSSRKKHRLFLRRASPSVASGLWLMPQPWPLGYSAFFVHGHQLRWILQLHRRAPSLFRRTDVCVRSCYVFRVSCLKIQSRRDILPRMLLYRLYTVPATAGRLQILNCSHS